MSAITVDELNITYSSIDGVIFDKGQTTITLFPPGRVGHYTIPNGVTSVGASAFEDCILLTSVTIPNSVTGIGETAFYYCRSLTNITIGNSVTNIGAKAFGSCSSLTNLTIPASVTYIGSQAFYYCYWLAGLYFLGDAPSVEPDLFYGTIDATAFYLPGTTGWGATLAGRPTVLLLDTTIEGAGVEKNKFVFIISGISNMVFVVEACTNLVNPLWFPLQTNTFTGDSFYFIDPQWSNYPARFYRVRSP